MLKLKTIINIDKEIGFLTGKNISAKTLEDFTKKANSFISLLENSQNNREESIKRDIDGFLKDIGYTTKIAKGDIDLTIEKDDKTQIIIETKSLKNQTEFIANNNLNCKSMWEAVSYFLEEHLVQRNNELKRIIITNGFEWYIFNAADFKKIFKPFEEKYHKYNSRALTDSSKTNLYKDICEYISTLEAPLDKELLFKEPDTADKNEYINAVYFNLKSINNPKLINYDRLNIKDLYNIFSPDYLLKEYKINNLRLNENFYRELLYILGLKETKTEGKILIVDANIENSFYYNLKNKGYNFESSLELIIIWINRILFLKLLESQICSFNNDKYRFLNTDKIKNFQDLNDIFFNVLANTKENRVKNSLSAQLEFVPYLNSSLFEKTDIEDRFISIESIRNDEIEYYNKTKLNTDNSNRSKLLTYLLDFLNAYDIKSGTAVDEKVINPALLGLIFEKINGYKDGSHYTPTIITSYMASQSIEKAVIEKFREKNHDVNSLSDIYNKNINDADSVINSIKICDPAVGSGHFLVSCLNELIRIKYYLHLIKDDTGRVFNQDFIIDIDSGELSIKNIDGTEFVYKNVKTDNSSYQLQKALFNQKKEIIENSLFGVDINPKSVEITRLRLWIELLKNAYYTKESGFNNLETLPNIDINIKQGDSLLNDLPLSKNKSLESEYINDLLFKNNEDIINEYKDLVSRYKTTNDKQYKQKVNEQIKVIKQQIRDIRINILSRGLSGLLSDYINYYGFENLSDELSQIAADNNIQETPDELDLFDNESKKRESKKEKDVRLKLFAMEKILNDIKEIKSGNTFEWTVEFPEILDESGNFIGLDLIIGNPPYIQLQKDGGKLADLYKGRYEVLDRNGDIYCLFYEQGINLLKNKGCLAYITSNKWMRAGYGEKLREYLSDKNPLSLIDLPPGVFESATVDADISIIQNSENKNELKGIILKRLDDLTVGFIRNNAKAIHKNTWFIGGDKEYSLKEKIESIGTPLKDWDVKIYRGIITGLNEAFIIDTAKREEILNSAGTEEERQMTELLIKPILRGRDIDKYSYKWADKWVIAIPAGWTNDGNDLKKDPEKFFKETYSSLYEYLNKYKEKAKKRDDQGDYWWELRPCAYYQEFEKEKIVWSDIATKPQFTILPKNIYFINTIYMISGENLKFLNGVLNSKIIKWYFPLISAGLGETGQRYFKIFVENIPIPIITNENQQKIKEDIESKVDKILKTKTKNPDANTSELERQIDELVYKLYNLTQEEIKIIENF